MKPCRQLRFTTENLPPEGITISGSVPIQALDVETDSAFSLRKPLMFELHLAPVQSNVLVRGHLSTTMRCPCDRCLEEFEASVVATDVFHLKDPGEEKVVDLTEDVREDILLAFPQRCLCRPDCRGLCPTCGANRNRDGCSCSAAQRGSDAWQALDGLRIKSGSE